MTPTDAIPDDPRGGHRRAAGTGAAILLVVAAVTADTTFFRSDGSHGPFLDLQAARAVILLLLAVLTWQLVRNPNKPDVRVAKAGILAAAVVAVVVGLDGFLVATMTPEGGAAGTAYPGPATWSLLGAGLLLIYTRFRRDLWPESRWEADILEASARRPRRG